MLVEGRILGKGQRKKKGITRAPSLGTRHLLAAPQGKKVSRNLGKGGGEELAARIRQGKGSPRSNIPVNQGSPHSSIDANRGRIK